MTVLYSSGVFVKSGRVAFEHHWGDKIAWFLTEALPNALSVLVLSGLAISNSPQLSLKSWRVSSLSW